MGREAVEVGKKLQSIGRTGERDQEGMEEEFFFSPSPPLPSPFALRRFFLAYLPKELEGLFVSYFK